MYLLLIALLVLAAPAQAQSITSTTIEVPGRTIEVAGLQRWTPAMMQDSMNVYAPGDSLHSHACAATLRYGLGFADAASFVIRMRNGTVYSFVPVIEPQDSALVRHRNLPRDTTGTDTPWTPLVKWARTESGALRQAIAIRIRSEAVGLPPVISGETSADSARIHEIVSYLQAHATPADAKRAREILADSPYIFDRVAAVAILSGFDRDDTTWHALVSTLRETDGVARSTASLVLSRFANEMPRPVDWHPALDDLHAILNGGNFFELHNVLDFLIATGVGPEEAEALLADGGHSVLVFAGAEYPMFRGPAHRFLRAVSGEDFGGDVAAWRAWIAEL